MFYYNFVYLCNLNQISPSAAAEKMGFQKSVITRWSRGTIPTKANQMKIATFFGISVDDLMTKKLNLDYKEKEPASGELTEKDKKDIARDLEALMEDLESSGDLMFDGDPATPEAVESIRNAMAMALEYAKKVNKEKYTPKKYQKGE